ncbi:MAG TPA: DUF423 domain-containing protein [bacterium]|nr:DUF423 domain-containing protein [Candidatus Omnitrophota bacterium]HOL93810.1 DUF423 domain-containing protein [bacterium]HPO99788.1 DUF423 domain-containing protein [bacterium]
MNRPSFFLIIACVAGGSGVILGAFAAHGLKDRLEPRMLEIFQTGVHYQMIHALALLAVSLAGSRLWPGSWTAGACGAWTLGILVFSGSLYLLAVTGIRWLGAITPIGGVAFIAGWIMLALAALYGKSNGPL